MILAEDEIGLGADHAGIMLLPETEPGTPLSDLLPLADDVLLVEATGNRPDLQSIYGIAREVATLYDLPLSDMAQGQSPGHGPERQVQIRIDDFEGCPRYVGRLFENVAIAAVAAVAAFAALPGRAAADLERRRHHELRDARARKPAPRLRLHDAPRRRDHRPPCRGRREADDARQHRAHPRRRRPRDRRRRSRRRARRDHGRRGDRDRRVDDLRPARGGQLRAVRHLPHLRAPAPAHRGLEPLGEGRRPLPRRPGRRRRDGADARAHRRGLDSRTQTSRATCRSGRSSSSGPSGPTR